MENDKTIRRRRLAALAAANVGALLLCPAFMLFRWMLSVIAPPLSRCVIHDICKLYCPSCGGTRAFDALLQLDFGAAVRYNVFLVSLPVMLAALDLLMLVMILKNKRSIARCAITALCIVALWLVVFFVCRNLLMIFAGFDPVGDLGAYWISPGA